MAEDSVSIFISYSHEDEEYRRMLVTHLGSLKREGLVSAWHDRMIPAGSEWDGTIAEALFTADIILLLVSAPFLDSEYVTGTEIPEAMKRHDADEAVVIPIFVRPVDHSPTAPWALLQGYPPDKKWVSTWPDKDDAWVTVVRGIRAKAEAILDERSKARAEKEKEERRRRESLEKARQIYLEKAREQLTDGAIDVVEREILADERVKLGLDEVVTKELEEEAAAPYREKQLAIDKYEQTLLKAVEDEFPISEALRNSLDNRKRGLGLKDDDVASLENRIFAQAQEHLDERQRAAEAAEREAAAREAAEQAAAEAVEREVKEDVEADAELEAEEGTDFGAIVRRVLQQAAKGDLRFDELFIAPDIPPKKLANAVKKCAVPDDEEVVGLVDLTVFGSAKDAFVFGSRRLHHRCNGSVVLELTDLASVRFEQDGSSIRVERDGPPPESFKMFFLSDEMAEKTTAILEIVRGEILRA
jgi:hypothetical protein